VSLKATIAKALDSAFSAVGDVAQTVVVKHFTGAPIRDSSTGTYTRSSVTNTIPGIVTDFKRFGDTDIVAGDVLCILKQKDTSLDVGDMATIVGKTYEVLETNPDPAGASWQAKLRLKKVTT